MKSLKIRHIKLGKREACDVPSWLDAEGVEWNDIDCVNWKEYPYQPEAKFRIVTTEDALVINYCVTEDSVAAVADGDSGRVWEDSCVEFFSSPADDGLYYNIECNCVGTLLVAVGKDRHERQRASRQIYENIKRWSSLGRNNFEEKMGNVNWQVALIIPYSTYFAHKITSLEGKTIRANVYKCGDKLSKPHFLSWNPIDTESPDFHRPEFFGEMTIS